MIRKFSELSFPYSSLRLGISLTVQTSYQEDIEIKKPSFDPREFRDLDRQAPLSAEPLQTSGDKERHRKGSRLYFILYPFLYITVLTLIRRRGIRRT